EDLALVELAAPNDDGLEGERALAQSGDHRLAAGLDALGDRHLALARQQLHRDMRTGSSVRSVGSLASALAGTFCWPSTRSPPSLSPSSSASSRGSSSSSRGSAPSWLVSWVSTTFTPISRNMASTSSICSELTSSEGNTELIWSWVR